MGLKLDNIIVVTPFHKRSEVSKIYLQNIKDLGLNLVSVCDVGDSENIKQCEEVGEVYISQQNITGDKWNKGLQIASFLPWTYVLILGSDDLVSVKYFEDIVNPLIKAKEKYIGLLDALAIHLKLKKFRYWGGYSNFRAGEPIGCGRLIHRSIIEKYSYSIFPKVHKGTIDLHSHNMIRKVYPGGTFRLSEMKPYRVGLKSNHDITSVLSGCPFIHDIDLTGYYSEEVIKLIKNA